MTVDGPRAPRPDERDELIAHVNRVMREEVGAAPTFHLDWAHVIAPEHFPNSRIIKVDGLLVSSTSIYWHDSIIGAVKLRVGGINGVSTDAAYRRRGFASQILRACLDRLRELGCHVSLLGTGVPSWYRKFGWEYAGVFRSYRFDRGNKHLLPRDEGVTLRAGTDADFAALAGIHNARRLGAVRSEAQMRAVMRRRNRHVWVGERNGQVAGYLWGAADHLREYGGPPDVVLPMLRELFESLDDPAVPTSTQSLEDRQAGRVLSLRASLEAPDRTDPITDALNELGILYSRDYLDMIRLEDVAGLLAAYPELRIAGREQGEGFEFSHGTERVRLSRTDAVKLLFGPERPDAFARRMLPLPFHEWSTDMV